MRSWHNVVRGFSGLVALAWFLAAPPVVATTAQLVRTLSLADATALERFKHKAQLPGSEEAVFLHALVQQADKDAQAAPTSVVDKTGMPPSGDKHDYMSLAIYAWPDPAKPSGKPYRLKDGEVNPESRSAFYDKMAMEQMRQGVIRLSLAYILSERESYAVAAVRKLRVWFLDDTTRMQPHLQFGQGIPGKADGRATGIIETSQWGELTDAIQLLAGSASLSAADLAGLTAWFQAYLAWLQHSPMGRQEETAPNNHGTWYDAQVAAFALFVGQPELARRQLQGTRRRIARQIEPDGAMPAELRRTASFNYSLYTLNAFFHCARVGERVGVDLWHVQTPEGRSIRQALDFMVPFADPSKAWQSQQITKRDWSQLHLLLKVASSVYGAPSYMEAIAKLPAEARWWPPAYAFFYAP